MGCAAEPLRCPVGSAFLHAHRLTILLVGCLLWTAACSSEHKHAPKRIDHPPRTPQHLHRKGTSTFADDEALERDLRMAMSRKLEVHEHREPRGRALTQQSVSGPSDLEPIHIGNHYCEDLLWTDTSGSGCDLYAASGWCGALWQQNMSVDGITADIACCGCGGGRCEDAAPWAGACPLWRSKDWCDLDGYGSNWDISINGTFADHTLEGINASEGCCGCGRTSRPPLQYPLSDYLELYRSSAAQVVSISLPNLNLSGEIPLWIGEYINLEELDLLGNSLEGQLPSSMQQLRKLRILQLSSTGVGGQLPEWLGTLPLQQLRLADNGFSGTLPSLWEQALELKVVELTDNAMLRGTLPRWMEELANATGLALANCAFSGSLPNLSLLSNLDTLYVANNRFSGSLPESVGSLQSLLSLYAWHNSFEGSLPGGLGNLRALRDLRLNDNPFEGSLPDAIGHLQALTFLNLELNMLTGTLPDAVGNLSALEALSCGSNSLSGPLPHAIAGLKSLRDVQILRTSLHGQLPEAIAQLQALRTLILVQNSFAGTLPQAIGELHNLTSAFLLRNSFEGPIPPAIGKLQNLGLVYLYGNNFGGELPEELLQLPHVLRLYVHDNPDLQGSIPSSISSMTGLLDMRLDGTRINGTLPLALFELQHLQGIRVSTSSLQGTIPSAIGRLQALEVFHVHQTAMQGTIPAALGSCTQLHELGMFQASFRGTLPAELARATALRHFSVQSNELTGTLPKEYASWGMLETYNVASNHFSGTIDPEALPYGNLTTLRLEGNGALAGVLPDLSAVSRLREVFAADCNITEVVGFPQSLEHLDLGGNRLTAVSEAFFNLPRLEVLILRGNEIASWPPKGAYRDFDWIGDFCDVLPIEPRFEWANLKIIDVSNNPLVAHVYVFLQTLFWSRSLLEVLASDCQLHGSIPRFDYRTSWTCADFAATTHGLPRLARLDMDGNNIDGISVEPPPALLLANFGNNQLTELDRSWFNEGFNEEGGSPRFPLSSLTLTGNAGLQFDVQPPFADCGPATTHAMLTADPSSFMELEGNGDTPASFECGVPCGPSGMALETDAGTPNMGSLCRCKEGYGLLPGQCFDEHWKDSNGESCRMIIARDGCNSSVEVAEVCCGCHGQGGGGNGRNCSRCPANTYSFSGSDIYRHHSECVACPPGASASSFADGGGGHSLCDCQCPIGFYLEGGQWCRDSQLHDMLASPLTGNELCVKCDALKTTLKVGALTEEECVCDIAIDGLVDATPNCGCAEEYYFNSRTRQCMPCSSEGEDCEWNGDLDASRRPPPLTPGYWASTAWQINGSKSGVVSQLRGEVFDGHSIYKCFSSDTCLDFAGTCARGRMGVACSLCKPGHYGGPDGPCLECKGSAFLGLASIVAGIPAVVLGAHLVLSGAGSNESNQKAFFPALTSFRVSLKQFITHLQVISVIGGFSIVWPAEVQSIYNTVSSFSFRFTDAFGIACLQRQQSAALELGFRYVVPCLFVVIGIFLTPLLAIGCARLLRMCIPKQSQLEQLRMRIHMGFDDSAKAVYWCCALFFNTFFKAGLLLFTCNTNPNDERTVQSYPHLHCFGSKSGPDSEWLSLAPAALIYTAVCLVGTVAVYYRAWKKTWKCLEDSDLKERGGNAFLFEEFRDRSIHWPMVLLAHHAAINLAGAGLSGFGPWQVLMTAAVNLVVGLMCLHDKPYIDPANNFMEFFNAFSLMAVCVFTAGMGFAVEPGLQDLESLATGSSAADKALAMRAKMLLVFQFVTVCCPMAVLAYQLILLIPRMPMHYLPRSVRPLTQEEEEDLRTFLKQVAQGEDVQEEHAFYKIVDKLDCQELLHISHCVYASPAAVGVLRSRGEPARMESMLQRGRTLRNTGSNPCNRIPAVQPEEAEVSEMKAAQDTDDVVVDGEPDDKAAEISPPLPVDRYAVLQV